MLKEIEINLSNYYKCIDKSQKMTFTGWLLFIKLINIRMVIDNNISDSFEKHLQSFKK